MLLQNKAVLKGLSNGGGKDDRKLSIILSTPDTVVLGLRKIYGYQ